MGPIQVGTANANSQDSGTFLYRQSSEKAHLNNSKLPRIELFQLMQFIVEGYQIDGPIIEFDRNFPDRKLTSPPPRLILFADLAWLIRILRITTAALAIKCSRDRPVVESG